MKPGHEMDALVAEKVKGWHLSDAPGLPRAWLHKQDDKRQPQVFAGWWAEQPTIENGGGDYEGQPGSQPGENFVVSQVWQRAGSEVWAPSTNVAIAWNELAMPFIKAGYAAWMENDGHTGYRAGVTNMYGRFEGYSDYGVAHAMCIAVLRSRGTDVEEPFD